MRVRKKPVIRRRPQVDPLRAKTPGSALSGPGKPFEPPPEPTRPATRADQVRPVFVSTIDDPKCIELRKQYKHDKSSVNLSAQDCQKLLAHLREYEQRCGAQRKYDKANEARAMRLSVRRAARSQASSRASRAEEDARSRDLKAIDKIIHDREQKMKREMNVYDQKTEEMKQQLRQSQQKTRADFVREWEHDKPSKYRKSSVQLLNLKTIERSLVLTGNYTGAKEMQRIIGQRENIEVEEQQEAMNDDFRAAKTKLVHDQNQAIEMLEEHRQAKKELSMVLLNAELQSAKNRKEVLRRKDRVPRFPRSDNSTNTVSYGTSFTHVARENGFGIQPLLPVLKPPTDKRQVKIHTESTKRAIVVCPPRAFTTKKPEEKPQPVFETEPNQTRNRKKYKRLPLRENKQNPPPPAEPPEETQYSYYYSYSSSSEDEKSP